MRQVWAIFIEDQRRVQRRREAVIHNNRGVTYANKGDYDCAIEAFTQAIVLNPDLAMAYSNRGGAYRDKGDYDRAIEDCGRAIALNPNLATAYSNRGGAYEREGDYDRAIEDFNKAIGPNPILQRLMVIVGLLTRAKAIMTVPS